MSDILISILLIIVGLGAGFGISVLVSYLRLKNAGKKIAELLKKAEIDAEKLKRDFILSAKEESYKHKQEVEREIKERKSELKESEERLIQREKNMDKRDETFQKRESLLDEREAKLQEKVASIQNDQAELERLKEEEMKLLTKISNMDPEKAKELIFARVEEKLQTELSLYIKEREEEARQSANVKAKDMLVSAMQKYASDVVNEQTVSTIALPNNEMKGRIIGREGRNIRTIEAITGVDLIIDDTPEAIVVSSFDPLRREIAKITIESLIKDGRIHPTRIEELYDKTVREIREQIFEYGNSALFELGIAKMDHELIELVGKLHFRTSYGQNALTHSLEVAHLAGVMAAELGENSQLAKRAGLLHDIGKAIDHEVEGSHVEIGVDLAKKFHESKTVINAIHSHHGDIEATSIISILVQIADSLSASRPGARNDSVESYIKRLEQLEHMTHGIAGVEKSYAIQAGRELRVLVKPEEVDDLKAHQIAREVKEKIESEMQYPGTIKVTVVREVRAQEEAK